MADTRHKNRVWNTGEGGDSVTWNGAQLAVLMDIRDELQTLTRILGCTNFLNMPHELRALRRAVDRLDKRAARRVPLKARS